MRLRRRSRSRRCSACGSSSGAATRGNVGCEVRELRRSRSSSSDAGVQSRAVACSTWTPTSKPCALEGGGVGVGRCGVLGVDVGGAADALPVGDASSPPGSPLVVVEAAGGAAVAVIVAGHHDRRLLAARQVPEARQRLAVARSSCSDQVGEQPLLLVGLRDRDFVEVDPVGLRIAGAAPKNRSSERIGRRCRRAPGRPRPDCPGACRRPSGRDRR